MKETLNPNEDSCLEGQNHFVCDALDWGIALFDLNGQLKYCNQAWQQALVAYQENSEKITLAELFPPFTDFASLTAQGKEFKTVLPAHNNLSPTLSISLKEIQNFDSKAFLCTLQNIQLQQDWQETIPSHFQILQTLIESIQYPIAYISESHFPQIWNSAYSKFHFHYFGQAPSHDWSPIHHLPTEQKMYWEALIERVINGQTKIVTLPIEIHGLSYFYKITLSPYRLGKNILGYVYMAQDITANQKALLALKKSRKEQKRAAEIGKIGLFDWNFSSETISINRELSEMLGLKTRKLKINCQDFLNRIPLPQSLFKEDHFELTLPAQVSSSQNTAWFWVRGECLEKNSLGQPQHFAGSVLDVSERQKMETRLKQALKEEQEYNRIKTAFIGMVSHEFRTPLTQILSATQILARGKIKLRPESFDLHLQTIQKAVKKINRLMDKSLFLSKHTALPASENKKLSLKPLSLQALCEDIQQEVQEVGQQTHTLILEIEPKESVLWLDQDLIWYALSNLLLNAVKYSPPGSEIRLKTVWKQNTLWIYVYDQGLGVPIAEQSKLFEPFFRGSNVQAIQGTGLGLSIVKNAIELHGGKIHYEPQLPKGSCFWIELPCKLSKELDDEYPSDH
ncbi:hypothetical protein COW36_16360 [bacterium (Candidatus Blackallbacteria) CG17_big_fil_post_rev_8_21_14_2_50_48_46]|uniref:histidine kinase n=1 Tax=bacterium (Candidatus Blackallbacteria) CG17_big_fil_post_rev_8_21_14_2_50_48_46 TaxID=2014261 RepID=A0A2M7G1P0_9BACT|nr:MAG: hypothetical protein COW64_08375 [bacterium (Candidatus Blackallbacteria) CG18_big_fil_WC_8_21_14_2_50_49_26]PIW15662.1 MAG: hypothetical protein COW36_16360 [bacterium (Candidatus Blackallbacteria) CG17_big_fil_post_rev_8_21_14_2_50_48_46]PIW47305.1 MAG: hypothetical protein COW20_13100 [bacterium (Candidatus Blackallbacteria) CG13_big_fil_rev_8_21_14_2_50_49_14]